LKTITESELIEGKSNGGKQRQGGVRE